VLEENQIIPDDASIDQAERINRAAKNAEFDSIRFDSTHNHPSVSRTNRDHFSRVSAWALLHVLMPRRSLTTNNRWYPQRIPKPATTETISAFTLEQADDNDNDNDGTTKALALALVMARDDDDDDEDIPWWRLVEKGDWNNDLDGWWRCTTPRDENDFSWHPTWRDSWNCCNGARAHWNADAKSADIAIRHNNVPKIMLLYLRRSILLVVCIVSVV
jgi:hypothetical protein